jgi:integrase
VDALKTWNAYFCVALLSPYFTSDRIQSFQIPFRFRFYSAAIFCFKNGHFILYLWEITIIKIPGIKFSAHFLRHTHATLAKKNGASDFDLQSEILLDILLLTA